MESYCISTVQMGLSVGSHEPGDGTREEILIADTDVAHHVSVPLPEGQRHALELGAHLDEAVQLDARSHAW